MNRTTKIVIGVIVGLLVLCGCCCLAGSVATPMLLGPVMEQAASMTENPQEIAQIAGNIVDYELPSGYTEQFAMSFLGFDIVAFGQEDMSEQIIILMQMPEMFGLNPDEMMREMEKSLQQQTGQQAVDMQYVDSVQTTIRDQNVTLTVQEGTDGDGTAIRQVTGVFAGQNGVAMLMIVGPTQTWDQEVVDTFLSSLR
jgi:hypothetical protein